MCLHFHLTRDIRYLTSSATALVGELGGPDELGGVVGSVGLVGLDEPGGPGLDRVSRWAKWISVDSSHGSTGFLKN